MTASPRWTPTSDAPQTCCQNCGTTVSKQFVRVFGSNDGKLYHCRECDGIAYRDLKWGAGTDPDYSREDRGQSASDENPVFRGEDA